MSLRQPQFEPRHAAMGLQRQLPSTRYHEQISLGAPAVRTMSLPASIQSRTTRSTIEPVFSIRPAGVSWKKLPLPILSLVLENLRWLHLGQESASCSTCYMRDLAAVQLTCKAWFSDAQRMLYTSIQLFGKDDSAMLLKWKLSRAARLIRLRSTLRSRPLVAQLVKTLHVPDPNIPLYKQNGDPNPEYDAYICTLASVVMACPNLEALTGFHAFYNHTFDRLTHALSTRRHLRQHVWIIAENDDVSQRGQTQLPPGLLDEYQSYQFIQYHDRWKDLETLVLCSPGGHGVIEHEVFIQMLHSLPALRQLCISSFDKDDFHDTTLLSLPPWVTTLRLEECLGVTDGGLKRWAAKPNAGQIERLSLIHQNITSLLTLSKIFASLDRLRKFTIVQNDVVPSLPKEMRHIVVQPFLASKSLNFLHWDISHPRTGPESRSHASTADRGQTTPNMLLALSISHRGFPSLRRLRAPRDTSPHGILQSVCQPIEDSIVLPDDTAHPYQHQQLRRSSSLRAARLRAQRIKEHNARTMLPNPSAGPTPQMPSRGGSTTQPGQHAASEASTTTLSSMDTVNSKSSKNSTGTSSLNRAVGHELVSPISSNQDPFSPLAPDDGIVSPIAADQDQMYLSGGDSDKQAVTGPERRRRRGDEAQRESICQCTPSPTMNRDSICMCEVHGGNPTERLTTVTPPPRSPFRPENADSADQPRTRFPSLIRTRQRRIPALYLLPDVPGFDDNGGLVGFGELIRISEKAQMSANGQNSAEEVQGDSKPRAGAEDSEEDGEDQADSSASTLCTGSWNQRTPSRTQAPELPVLQKIMSASSATSAKPGSKARSRSKSKSSSRLSLSLGLRSSEKDATALSNSLALSHVGRPRGDRGGCITVEDFF